MMRKMFIVFFILSGSCQYKHPSNIPLGQIDFKTRPDTELFFKNLRSIYYDNEEQTNTKLLIYRFKNRPKNLKTIDLNLAIVHNWRFNEAYLLIDTINFSPPHSAITLICQNPKNRQKSEIKFKGMDKKAHFEFAYQVYEAIIREENISLQKGTQLIPILSDSKSREAFRITVKDYLGLVGKL
jgi:hypothetical protein